MGDAGIDPTLAYTLPFQLTNTIHRKKVPYILSSSNPQNRQADKIVVITGGGTGIGAAAARVWAQARAHGVVIVGRRKHVLEEMVASLQQLCHPETTIVGIPADITVEDEVAVLFEKVKTIFGRAADVVIANAGLATDFKPSAADSEKRWWSNFEVNVLGLRNTVTQWILSQEDPERPTGTVINVNTGLTGVTIPGSSGYSSSKLAAHRYMEFLDADYPTLRSFSLLPGVVDTGIVKPEYIFFAQDNVELTGSLALYLSTSRADYLKGSLTSVNWDYEEMEQHKSEIGNGMLKMKWIPVLPCCGGKGLGNCF